VKLTRFSVILGSHDSYLYPKLYDWLLVLDREVNYIWRASWNYTKVLYLLTRYAPFVSIALLLRSEFHFHLLAHLPAHFRSASPAEWNPTLFVCLNMVFHVVARSEWTPVRVRSSYIPIVGIQFAVIKLPSVLSRSIHLRCCP